MIYLKYIIAKFLKKCTKILKFKLTKIYIYLNLIVKKQSLHQTLLYYNIITEYCKPQN